MSQDTQLVTTQYMEAHETEFSFLPNMTESDSKGKYCLSYNIKVIVSNFERGKSFNKARKRFSMKIVGNL